jgi:serine/threonine-protein kinase
MLQRALPMAEKINGHESQQVASILTELGIRERAARHYDAAVADYRQALAIRERMVGPDNPDCAAVHNNIGNVLRDEKHYDEAKVELERAIAIWTKAWSPQSPAIAVGLGGLGKIAMAEGHLGEAESYFRRGLAITRAKRPPGHPDISSDLQKLGGALLAEKKPEAVAVFEEVLAATEKDADASAGDRADARFDAARARVELGIRKAGALELAESACKALDQPEWQDSLHECRAWLAAHGGAAR